MGQAARLFNGSAEETLYSRITPSKEQREFLQEHWNALAEYLREKLYAKYGYRISTWLQGSYKYGTLIKPVRLGEEYDVDLGVYYEWPQEQAASPEPKQLRKWVQQELYAYRQKTAEIKRIEEPPKERCSRVVYERHFHIDTPVYHLDPDRDYRRLACWSNRWEESDPKPLYKWFKEVVPEEQGEQLRRIVRYLKAWAAIAFEGADESRPSSILLTVLVAREFEEFAFWMFTESADDDMLAKVVGRIYERLCKNPRVPNPVDESEDLNRIPETAWHGFLTRLHALHDCAQRATKADDEATAALIWSEQFSYLIPLPEVQAVEVVEEQSNRALMQLPDIQIEVYSRNPRRLIARHQNEVPAVAKDCDLEFSIVNPHVVPEYATVEWTVRNSEQEAAEVGDLGHRRGGMRVLRVTEHTSYAGRHCMDCVVRLNGNVYAVRRVPVTIMGVRHPVRHRPKPAHSKLRSILRRRL